MKVSATDGSSYRRETTSVEKLLTVYGVELRLGLDLASEEEILQIVRRVHEECGGRKNDCHRALFGLLKNTGSRHYLERSFLPHDVLCVVAECCGFTFTPEAHAMALTCWGFYEAQAVDPRWARWHHALNMKAASGNSAQMLPGGIASSKLTTFSPAPVSLRSEIIEQVCNLKAGRGQESDDDLEQKKEEDNRSLLRDIGSLVIKNLLPEEEAKHETPDEESSDPSLSLATAAPLLWWEHTDKIHSVVMLGEFLQALSTIKKSTLTDKGTTFSKVFEIMERVCRWLAEISPTQLSQERGQNGDTTRSLPCDVRLRLLDLLSDFCAKAPTDFVGRMIAQNKIDEVFAVAVNDKSTQIRGIHGLAVISSRNDWCRDLVWTKGHWDSMVKLFHCQICQMVIPDSSKSSCCTTLSSSCSATTDMAAESLDHNQLQASRRLLVAYCTFFKEFARVKSYLVPQTYSAIIPDLEKLLRVLSRNNQSSCLDDEEVIDQCLWTLSYIGDGDDRVHAVSTPEILKIVAERLNDPRLPTKSLIPVIRMAGNFTIRTDISSSFLPVVFPSSIPRLLKHAAVTVRKETYWMLSNLAGGSAAEVEWLRSSGCLPQCVAGLTDVFTVKKEAMWLFKNLSDPATPDDFKFLCHECKFLEPFLLMDIPDHRLLLPVLDSLTFLLDLGAKSPDEMRDILFGEGSPCLGAQKQSTSPQLVEEGEMADHEATENSKAQELVQKKQEDSQETTHVNPMQQLLKELKLEETLAGLLIHPSPKVVQEVGYLLSALNEDDDEFETDSNETED